MLSLNVGDTKTRTGLRWVSRVATLCGVCCLLSLNMGGCPPQPTACTGDAGCDDSNGCTTDTCVDAVCENVAACDDEHCVTATNDAGDSVTGCVECIDDGECDDGTFCNGVEICELGGCEAGTAPCAEDEICDEEGDVCVDCLTDADCVQGFCSEEAGNMCVECITDAQCDDGEFCTGTETCVGAACVATGDPCGAAEVCDEAADDCVPPCDSDADCDDDDDCTDDTCDTDAGTCTNAEKDCDDGVACTDDACDAGTGDCTNTDNCTGGESCDLSIGECTTAPPCAADADCDDDGDFCNGTESCDEEAGICVSSGDPCAEIVDATCNEDLNRCDVPPPETQDFTLGLDNLAGTAAANNFDGLLAFNPPTGTNVPTVQTGDTANGGDGADTMTAIFNFTAVTTVAPTLTSVETLTVTDFGTAATTLQGTGITGLTTLNTLNSTNANALVVNNLAAVVDAGITNNTAGLSLTYLTAATSGTADDMTLALSNVTAGTLTLTSATTNGIETMTITSTGAANTLAAITQTLGTTLATINKSGDTSLTVTAALPATVATVNASTDTGGLVADVSGNTGNTTTTGGSGNDTFILGANYTTTDIVNGNGGTDTLGLTSATAAAAAAQANVTNMEALTVSDGLAASVTASRFGSIATVNLQSGFTGAVTLTAASAGSVNLGARAASNDSTANGTVDIPGLGTADALTFAINDSDTNSAYIFTGVETLNLSSNNRGDGNAADGAVNTIGGALTLTPTFGTGTINVTGAAALTVTGAVTAGTLTATSFTGNLVMTAASGGAIVIGSGSGNDTLFGSAAGDSLNGGTGTNVFEGLAGVDSLTLGSGTDTVRIFVAAANGVDRKLVQGFTAGSGGDVLNIDGDGLNVLDGTDNFATASSIQAHAAAGNLTVAAASEIVRVTSGTVANLTEANSLNGTNLLVAIGGTITAQAAGNEHLFLVADASGNTGVYYGDAGADTGIVAGELTLVAVLQGTTIANLVFSNFSNAN